MQKMIIDKSWILDNYNKYNKLYWDGKLPQITPKLSTAKSFAGRASAKDYNGEKFTKFAIVISNYRDYDEDARVSILLHEMIHIADYFFHPEHFITRERYDAHGYRFFIPEAERVTKLSGVGIYKTVTREQHENSTFSEKTIAKINKAKSEYTICIVSHNPIIDRKGKLHYKSVFKLPKNMTISEAADAIKRNVYYKVAGVEFYTIENYDYNDFLSQKRGSVKTGWLIDDCIIDEYIKHAR